MSGNRKYERYVVSYTGDSQAQIEAIVEGEAVHLVDFSLGGFFFLSGRSFSMGETVNISINLENRGNIALMGKVVRVIPEGEKWGVAIDLTHPYSIKTHRK
jgi:Tfp pilus assembly protein PilZ